jgi:hypothetical protein
MFPWYDVALGWVWITTGIWKTWRDGRPLLSHSGDPVEVSARRKARLDLRFSLFSIAIGVGWLARWYEHDLYLWLISAYFVLLVTWDLFAWHRSRKSRRSCSQTPAKLSWLVPGVT